MNIKHILWTGGWDSTFRVLDLMYNNKKTTVQPHYIISQGRSSVDIELKTMEKIKDMVANDIEEIDKRILPTKVTNVADIPKNETLTRKIESLKERSYMGNQYDWLARYADWKNLNNLELSVHADDTVQVFVGDVVEKIETENDIFFKLPEELLYDDLSVFSYFNFPLLDMTKLDMQKQAEESGFLHIMEETWFCHSPIKGEACGMCKPCIYTREEGLGRRVPTPSMYKKLKRYSEQKINAAKSKIKNFI